MSAERKSRKLFRLFHIQMICLHLNKSVYISWWGLSVCLAVNEFSADSEHFWGEKPRKSYTIVCWKTTFSLLFQKWPFEKRFKSLRENLESILISEWNQSGQLPWRQASLIQRWKAARWRNDAHKSFSVRPTRVTRREVESDYRFKMLLKHKLVKGTQPDFCLAEQRWNFFMMNNYFAFKQAGLIPEWDIFAGDLKKIIIFYQNM